MAFLGNRCVSTHSQYGVELLLLVKPTSVKEEKRYSALPDA